jgi:hypothetical protein
MWFLAQGYLAHVYNLCANSQLNWQKPQQVLMLYWFEPVLSLDSVTKFPETTEKPVYFVGFVDNAGDALTFKILKNY